MPLRPHGSKVHKELLINTINLVKHGGFVPLWQKKRVIRVGSWL
jgi:hypothetical protein